MTKISTGKTQAQGTSRADGVTIIQGSRWGKPVNVGIHGTKTSKRHQWKELCMSIAAEVHVQLGRPTRKANNIAIQTNQEGGGLA